MLLAGQQIWLLASGGVENVATLGDTVTAGCADAEIVGSQLLHFREETRAAMSGNGAAVMACKLAEGRPCMSQ